MLFLRFPTAKQKVDAQLDEARLKIENTLVPKGADVVRHLALPPEGRSPKWITEEMEKMDKESEKSDKWKMGRLSGAVYRECKTFDSMHAHSCQTQSSYYKSTDGGEDIEAVIVDAFRRYCVSNPLHPDAFPTVRKMEAEIVAMCLRMYNNPDGAGTTTSGGTESIIMAVKTHRDWARDVKGITEPEM